MTSVSEKKRWSDLTPAQQRLVVVGGALEMAMTAWALRDLARRPAADVRGPKWLWGASFVVQPVGPVAYAVLGRQ